MLPRDFVALFVLRVSTLTMAVVGGNLSLVDVNSAGTASGQGCSAPVTIYAHRGFASHCTGSDLLVNAANRWISVA